MDIIFLIIIMIIMAVIINVINFIIIASIIMPPIFICLFLCHRPGWYPHVLFRDTETVQRLDRPGRDVIDYRMKIRAGTTPNTKGISIEICQEQAPASLESFG